MNYPLPSSPPSQTPKAWFPVGPGIERCREETGWIYRMQTVIQDPRSGSPVKTVFHVFYVPDLAAIERRLARIEELLITIAHVEG